MAGFNLSQLSPAFEKIVQGRQAAARIYTIIDRKPLINNPEKGLKPERIDGIIKFENVTFAYPKEPTRKIL
jgi:ABC-type multidrug transport system fused ATPase/permease subunit